MKLRYCMGLICFVSFSLFPAGFLVSPLSAQTFLLTGTVTDAESHEPLIFAHLLVEERGSGVVTNQEGEFRLNLPPGVWTLRVSFIGYRPQTRLVTVRGNLQNIDFTLQPRTFNMPQVTVTPDDSLARLIVRRARQRRIEREKELISYHKRANTKTYSRIDSTKEMSDELSKKLTAYFLDIGETQTEAWFKQPDYNKVLIHARRQTDLFEQLGNRMHSGWARADFSREELEFGTKSPTITGPISEAGLDDVYWYSVTGVTSGERHNVYRIRVLPKSKYQPSVSGFFYIEDSTWSITQVDLELNSAARALVLPISERMSFRQQFSLYEGRHWLPSAGSVAVQAKINSLGMQAWLAMEVSSVIAEYEINPADIDTVFDEYKVEVLPHADSTTDEEWAMYQLQPPSLVDAEIYRISDSMAVLRAKELMEYSAGHIITGKQLQQDNMLWDVPGIVNAVRFNRVEGLSLALPYASEDKDGLIRKYSAEIGYGFLDRRLKGSASGRLALGGNDPSFLSLDLYHDLSPTFRNEQLYGEMLATSLTVFDRYDGRDYFYRRGGRLGWSMHAVSWLETEIGAEWTDYSSAEKHTDWSLIGEGKYRENPLVIDGDISFARLSFSGDFRSRSLDAGRILRSQRQTSDFIPGIGAEFLRLNLDAGKWEVFIPQVSVSGSLGWGTFGSTDFRISWARATDRLPLQNMLTLPGSEPGLTAQFRFRSVKIGEFGGDERAMILLDHNFGKLPLLWLGLPEGAFYAAEMWELRMFASFGWTRMRESTALLLTRDMSDAQLPLVEAGISISNLFGIMRIDAGHRVTHLGSGTNYFIGISIAP